MHLRKAYGGDYLTDQIFQTFKEIDYEQMDNIKGKNDGRRNNIV